MNSFEFDTVIIGGGCIGSGIAFHLNKNGFKNIALVDSGRKTVSATAQSGGLLRVFHESTEHVDLALKNAELVKRFQDAQIISEVNSPNGNLYFFDRRRFRDYENNLQMMESAQYPFEVVTPKIGSQRFPWYQWSQDQWAIYEPLASHLSPSQFSEDLLNFSVKGGGVTLFDDYQVDRICFFRDRYRIVSGAKTIMAKTLVMAGGARMLPHLQALGIGHALKKQALTIYKSKQAKPDFLVPNFFDRETLQYAGRVSGHHMVVSKLNLENLNQDLDVNDFTEIEGMDCYAPNRIGYAGWLPGHPRLLLATGWGGTAFKFSLEIGQRVARAMATENSERSLIHA